MLASGRHGLERPQTLDSAARSRQQRGVPHRSRVTPDTLCASSSGRPAVWTTASATGHLTGVRRAQAVASPAGVASSPSPSPRPAPSSEIDYFLNDSRPVILFDGVCNMCNGGVNFMLDWDAKGVYRLAALQSTAGRSLLKRCGRSPDDISSIVLVEKDRHFVRSEAILRIGMRLNVPLPALAALGFPVPLPLRDALYDLVADNRYSVFGRTQQCRLTDQRFAQRFIAE